MLYKNKTFLAKNEAVFDNKKQKASEELFLILAQKTEYCYLL